MKIKKNYTLSPVQKVKEMIKYATDRTKANYIELRCALEFIICAIILDFEECSETSATLSPYLELNAG